MDQTNFIKDERSNNACSDINSEQNLRSSTDQFHKNLVLPKVCVQKADEGLQSSTIKLNSTDLSKKLIHIEKKSTGENDHTSKDSNLLGTYDVSKNSEFETKRKEDIDDDLSIGFTYESSSSHTCRSSGTGPNVDHNASCSSKNLSVPELTKTNITDSVKDFSNLENYLEHYNKDQISESNDVRAKTEEVKGWIEILNEDFCKECYGEYPDFLYHIARNKYGALYFRVIRNLLLNKVLCSNRVSQMTKTYNDIEAVTRLLEEKEKDLELTARIGQQLLTRTGTLEARVSELEGELRSSNERAAQLAHDLAAKSELVRVLASDQDAADSVDGGDDELDSPTGDLKLSGELLRRKLRQLEQDNRALRGEAARLLQDTDACEEAEAKLLKDFTAQLSSANLEVDALHEELERQKEENRLQNERIQYLVEKLNEAEMRLHKFSAENEQMSTILNVTRENQCSLASELAEFKERHAEAMALLRDAQEQLRRQRRKAAPAVRGCGIMPSLIYANGGGAQPDSLQSELESSLYSEISMDSGISGTGLTPDFKKVFNTVQCASKNTAESQNYPTLQQNYDQGIMSSSNQPRMSSFQCASSNRSSMYSNSTQGLVYLESPALSDTEDIYPGAPVAGVPGIPGAEDLRDALKRLTPAEVMTRRAVLSGGPLYADYDYDFPRGGVGGPVTGWRTPDSVMSTGGSSSGVSSRHSGGGSSGGGGSMWRPPRDVLQLVKPLEGSHTLRHWSRLATPTLAGLLEERPGVQIRGGRGLDELGMELYTLSDLEEDDDISLPGKRFQNSGCVYTYTNSTVMHPDDGSICGGTSEYGSRLCSAQPTPGTQTPAPRTRSNSTCSTFSTNMGLASVLNERGIIGATPSCFNTPASTKGGIFATGVSNGQVFTPTATPCNSPDGSPIATPRCSSPEPLSPHAGIASLLSQGADLLWRTFGTGLYQEKPAGNEIDLSSSDTKSVSSIGLMDSVKRLGLESLVLPPGETVDNKYGYNEPLSLHLRGAGSVITRRDDAGPMARLASIRAALKEAESHTGVSHTPISQKDKEAKSTDEASSKASQVASPSPRRARAGAAAADRRARMRERRVTRTDLGTVVSTTGTTGAAVKKEPELATTSAEPQRRSAFGAIGALLFGRKGGLL